MQIEVRALDADEWEAAEPGDYVCGSLTLQIGSGLKTVYLYIKLGRQLPYTKQGEKYAQTEFKRFLGCEIEVYESLEDLDNATFTNKASGVDVILFYQQVVEALEYFRRRGITDICFSINSGCSVTNCCICTNGSSIVSPFLIKAVAIAINSKCKKIFT